MTAKRRPPRRPGRGNPTETELAAARRMSRRIHGVGGGDVVELSAAERRLPRFLPVIGTVPELEYQPSDRSKRRGVPFVHRSGDRGRGAKASDRKPILAIDPKTKRPVLLTGRSPMKWTDRGLIG